jgi:branched-chain amino acid transport system ATP-binding protein
VAATILFADAAGAGRGNGAQMSALLEVERVRKSFGGVVANRDVSLRVPEGAIVGLIGPNGSGKTTLFNCIAGQHPVDGGSIRFAGREISRLRMAQIARLGMIRTFQHTRVFRNMSCMRNLFVSAQTDGNAVSFRRIAPALRERAEQLLEFVGLDSKRDVEAGELSFGHQKLLEFAMALMAQPKLLLLDEPTAGINPTLINALLEKLRYANARFGVTLLVIEHNMRVIMSLAQRVYCLAHGEILADDTPERLLSDSRVIDAYLGAR